MSDYLTNLIARSRGELQAIRPRLPSLYEPCRPGTAFNLVRTGANEFEQGVSGTGLKPVSSMFNRERTELSAAESSEENREAFQASSPPAGSLLPRRGAWRTWNVSTPDRADGSSKNKWNSLEPSSTAPIVAQPSSDGTLEPDARANRFTESRVPAETPDGGLRRNQNFTTARRSESSFDRPLHLDLGNLESATPNRAAAVQFQPAAGALRSARSEGAWSQHRAQRSTPHESPINITIGRVEVRAIMPAPSARRAVPAKPRATLSLDDYLKRRDRGRR